MCTNADDGERFARYLFTRYRLDSIDSAPVLYALQDALKERKKKYFRVRIAVKLPSRSSPRRHPKTQ